MTTTTPPIPHPAAPPHSASATVPPGRGWAWAGVAGGAIGAAGLFATSGIVGSDDGAYARSADLVSAIEDSAGLVWAQQVVCVVAAACLVVFGTGLRRHLAQQEPAHSLVPGVALGGVLLTAAAVFIGGGISTELVWALTGDTTFDPAIVGSYVGYYATIAWLWGGLGLAAGAVALGGLRRGSVGRFVTVESLLLALALAATQVMPVQYIAVVPGGLWLVLTGTALALAGRGQGAARS
ncbi:hypothetical protein [Blastococcus sp. CCUG 61487]|uniref:hypothetical protein n=1 Tax=Blastococcus sp. CCUG 61487 TaxID=1840703 RepID=UPI0010C0DC5C|nr:hypothetical protein [Blastococcus sp. CCUG 61487]TKJ30539.1 hypothetical protein A6V29_18825 [Blastococcus sp. CCUG 61487]